MAPGDLPSRSFPRTLPPASLVPGIVRPGLLACCPLNDLDSLALPLLFRTPLGLCHPSIRTVWTAPEEFCHSGRWSVFGEAPLWVPPGSAVNIYAKAGLFPDFTVVMGGSKHVKRRRAYRCTTLHGALCQVVTRASMHITSRHSARRDIQLVVTRRSLLGDCTAQHLPSRLCSHEPSVYLRMAERKETCVDVKKFKSEDNRIHQKIF